MVYHSSYRILYGTRHPRSEDSSLYIIGPLVLVVRGADVITAASNRREVFDKFLLVVTPAVSRKR